MATFESLINSERPVLVDFFATWCGSCKMLAPILEEVKTELGNTVTILKIDVDKNQQLAGNYQVRGVPTLILFAAGQPVWRQSGVLAKNDIVKSIRRFAK